MSRTHTIAVLLAAALASAFVTTEAHAVQRTHVSAAIGVDTNTATGCTPVAPCRTFQSAMTVTDPNGEVVVLDSGGYGAVTITQSVALIAPTGVYAGISVFPNANGVTIATPGVNVVLRGLTINGQGGDSGILMTAGNTLTVENCVISNLKQVGVLVIGDTTVRITDTVVRDNRLQGVFLENGPRAAITRATISGHSESGVRLLGRGDSATLTVADIGDSTISGNNFGVAATSQNATTPVKISVRDSRIVQNRNIGLTIQSDAGAAAILSASNNLLSRNAFGIAAVDTGSRAWASGNTVSDNTGFGLFNNGALFESAGNNAVRNNGTNKNGTITVISTE